MKSTENQNAIKKFRKALLKFFYYKLNYYFNKGIFDNDIRDFLTGDSFKITYDITLQPNDVIFMRELIGLDDEIEMEKIVEKLKHEWDKNGKR